MSAFAWVERNPVLSFFCASLVLYYIYGICWTAIIIFTIYLLDETFKDKEEEKIFGKRLLNVRNKLTSSDIAYKQNFIVSTDYNNMFPSYNNCEKKPTLESLIHQKKSKDNVVRYERQPLAAVVKNNMQMHLSNIDLEKRKPIYQCMRSPLSPSIASTGLSRNTASPSFKGDRSYFGLYNGSPSLNRSNANILVNAGSPSLNRSNANILVNPGSPSMNRSNLNISVNTSVVAPSNDSLEVHGSYFINKSVLHSPATERSINDSSFSPSHVPFYKNVKSSATSYPIKCTTESVVEALKQKSKRKRAIAELPDESNIKKKKIDNDIDSTLNDLLPTTQSLLSVKQAQPLKRKNVKDKEVTSTGVQCLIDDEMALVKKKKSQTENEISYLKYGLSQTQINELSNETSCTKDANKTEIEETCIVDDEVENKHEKKETPKNVSFKDTIKNIAYDCSFKSVSFTDTTPDKKSSKDPIIQKSSLKLSALKNMESPYKRLFNSGSTKNITPESIKKMRKHPVYFTAKINIDEIQQHREEFGESGVSLKAFRLDQEEAIKRVNNLFDDNDSDVDFKSQPASGISLVTSSTLATSIAVSIPSGLSSNLIISSQPTTLLTASTIKSNPSVIFGSTAPSAVVFSSAAMSTASLSFGHLTSTISFAPVTSVMFSKANIVVTSVTTTAGLNLQHNSGVPTTEVQPTLVPSSAPLQVAPAAFNFGTLPNANLPGSIMPGSTSIGTVLSTQSATSVSANAIPQIITTSNNFNFNFGAGGGSTASTAVQSSLQFATLQKPIVSSTTTISDSNKVSFSLGEKPTVQNTPAISSSLIATMPNSTQFNFSFQPQPPQTVNSFQSNQNTMVSSTAINVQQTAVSTSGIFGVNTSSSQSLSFGATPAAGLTKDMFISVSSSGLSFPSTNVSTMPPALSTVPSLSGNIFGQLPTSNALGNSSSITTTQSCMFGNASTTITTLQSSIFGNSSTTTTTTSQSSMFGSAISIQPSGLFKQTTTSTGIATIPANIFAPQNKLNGFSFASATAPSTGFNFGAIIPQGNAVSSTANAFNVSNTSAAQSNIFGQAAPLSTNVQAPQNIFGVPLASATSSQTIFGAPTVSMSSTQSMFGAPAVSVPSTQNIFGNTSQNTFGSSTQNTFGSSSNQNVFGAAQQQSIFGDQSKISTGFNFGSTAVTAAPTVGFSFGTSTTKSVFGQSNVFGGTTATNNTGVFGTMKPVDNPFGQQPKSSTGFDFSGSLSQGPTINFGAVAAPAGNAFPTQPQQPKEMGKPSFNFGSQPATPTFGATPASPAFGSIQQPTFGSPQPFGTPNLNPAAGGGFTIGSGTSNPPPTRQTQRARRRLRR